MPTSGTIPWSTFSRSFKSSSSIRQLVVSGKLPVRSLPELVAWLKANPDQATFGSPGAGSAAHFAGMEFGRLAKLDLRHVAYKGTPTALPDLLTGRIPMYIASMADFIEHHKAGTIRILATMGASRSRFLPDVPTLRESGFDVEAPNSFAMYAPAGTPSTVAERLRAAIIDALNNGEIRTRIETLGFEITGTTGEALAQILARRVRALAADRQGIGLQGRRIANLQLHVPLEGTPGQPLLCQEADHANSCELRKALDLDWLDLRGRAPRLRQAALCPYAEFVEPAPTRTPRPPSTKSCPSSLLSG